MTNRDEYLGKILSALAEAISITPSMQEKATNSYVAVGKWIGNHIFNSDVEITPQGSMNLGTIIKPIDESDDYDIDLVCNLIDAGTWMPDVLKKCVGNALSLNEIYNKNLEPEGRRCWTLNYDEFHMDILPCSPTNSENKIRLTDKDENGKYENRSSNPKGYHDWFMERMLCERHKNERQKYAIRNQVKIEDVPAYRIHTTLQKVVQLIKRHRDIYFKNDDNSPVSIIITTLAAKAYNKEENVYLALKYVINNMERFIEVKNGVYYICNPCDLNENFADKWNEFPERRRAFYSWLSKLKKDMLERPMMLNNQNEFALHLKSCMGERAVNRAFNLMGEETLNKREDKDLSVSGLTCGAVSLVTPVKGHTFFGVK